MNKTIWVVRGWLLALTILLTVLLVSSRQASHKNAEQIEQVCRSFASVGNLDIPASITKTGVQFVVEHRNAAIGLGCGDLLEQPTPLLRQKAQQYNIRMEG